MRIKLDKCWMYLFSVVTLGMFRRKSKVKIFPSIIWYKWIRVKSFPFIRRFSTFRGQIRSIRGIFLMRNVHTFHICTKAIIAKRDKATLLSFSEGGRKKWKINKEQRKTPWHETRTNQFLSIRIDYLLKLNYSQHGYGVSCMKFSKRFSWL